MRTLLRLIVSGLLAASTPAPAADSLVGRYRLEGDHDAAGELRLRADGRFEYALAYGALDEHAEGQWVRHGAVVALATKPRPVPPAFRLAAPSSPAPGAPTLRVTWPDGRGVAGVDFRIGFDSGDPIEDYTQEDGWRLSPDEHRTIRWIELSEPIYGVVSPRFQIDHPAFGTINVVLVPNDMGVVDFSGMAINVLPGELVIHRRSGTMRFVRTDGER